MVFPPGEGSETISVKVFNDGGIASGDKTFSVALSNPRNAKFSRPVATGTIVDRDRTITIDDTTVTEGDVPGSVTANFHVALSSVSLQPTTVDYSTQDGTALSGANYVRQTGTVTFLPGEATATISVPILSDPGNNVPESPLIFYVNLSNPVNAQVSRARGTGFIVGRRTISIADATVTEGDTGATDAPLVLTLSSASPRPVTVTYTTADETATAPADYVPTTGTATIGVGSFAAACACQRSTATATASSRRIAPDCLRMTSSSAAVND